MNKSNEKPAMRRIRRGLAAVVALGLALALWAFVAEPASLVVRRYSIVVPSWSLPRDLTVALLGDVHTGSPFNSLEKLQRIVDRTQDQRPDLVLLAGDYVIHGVLGGRFVTPEETAQTLGRLRAPQGVFAVLGNHDWWLDAKRVRSAMEAAGIRVLEDEHLTLTVGERPLALVGLSDFEEGARDVEKALRGIGVGTDVLAFTHNPDLFPELPVDVGLTLAGHTHGGQVALPWLGRPIVPSRYGQRYAVGLVEERGRLLFVTPGLGTSILPVRFRVKPEISLLELSGGRVAPR